MNFLTIDGLEKVFNPGVNESRALEGVDLKIGRGEFIVISGPSGSGKTTLLNIIGGLDAPTSGQVSLESRVITGLDEEALCRFRRDEVGFVFQAYNLIPVLTVRENIAYVMRLAGLPQEACERRVAEVAAMLDIDGYLEKFPDELSGGQQQRVAVARAVAGKPKLILADEPTANLDTANAEKLMAMMARLNEEEQVTVIFSSHDPLVISKARRSIVLRDGKVVEDRVRTE